MSDFDDLRQIREAKENAEVLARQKKLDEERQRADALWLGNMVLATIQLFTNLQR